FSSRRRHTILVSDWSSDVCSSDLDDRLFAAHIRNGRLWTAQNIAVTSAGVASNSNTARRDGIRWYELNGIRSTDNAGVPVVVERSEERRVGKEGRCRGGRGAESTN